MSGIVGSKFNIRGSGLVGSLGTDGQHMLSAGAGKTNVFETIAAAGGAWTFISNTTISSATTINVTSGIDSTYAVYKFLFSGVMFDTDDRSMRLQFYVDGSVVDSGDYKYSGSGSQSRNTGGIQYGDGTTTLLLNYDSNEADTDASQDMEITLFNPSSTSIWKQVLYQSTNITHLGDSANFRGGALLENTAAVTGIRLLASDTGNFTAGNIRLYGVSNA